MLNELHTFFTQTVPGLLLLSILGAVLAWPVTAVLLTKIQSRVGSRKREEQLLQALESPALLAIHLACIQHMRANTLMGMAFFFLGACMGAFAFGAGVGPKWLSAIGFGLFLTMCCVGGYGISQLWKELMFLYRNAK